MTTANKQMVEKEAPELVLTRLINAPRELVWRAWTDAESIKLWFRPDETIQVPSAKADVRVGGKYRIQMRHPDGEFYTAVGSYRAVKAHELLSFTWAWEKDGSEADFGEVEPNESLVTIEFHALGWQTELVLKHEKFATVESRDKHEHGWGLCLDQLAKFVAK